MSKKVRLTVASVLAVVCGGLAWGEDLGAVEKQIQEAWAKQKSLAAKLRTEVKFEQMGMTMESRGEGTFEFMRKGDKILARTEMTMNAVQKIGAEEMKRSQSMLSIVDGEVTYSLNEFMDQKFATKSRTDPGATGAPGAIFEQLHKSHELKLAPEQSVGGRKTHVIEAVAKESMPGDPVRKTVLYFDQDSGFMIKMQALTEGDKPLSTIEYIDVKLNASIDDDRFVFKAPEGVEVVDQTQPAAEPGAPPADKPAERPAGKPAETQPEKP